MVTGGLRELRAEAQLPQPVLEPNEVQLIEYRRLQAIGRRNLRRVGRDRDRGDEHG
jgi:hypothetical protein